MLITSYLYPPPKSDIGKKYKSIRPDDTGTNNTERPQWLGSISMQAAEGQRRTVSELQ